MTRFTNTARLATAVATLATVMLAYSAIFAPASAQPGASTSTSTPSSNAATSTTTNPPYDHWTGPGDMTPFHGKAFMRGDGPGGVFQQSQPSLTVGQTITVTSTQGEYFLTSDHTKNGTASGTLTFTVTGKLMSGYTLSITSGSLVVNGTTYTVTSGSAQTGRGASYLVGQGATSSSGQFLVKADARGSFAGTTSQVSIDLSAGTTEYIVFLAGGITG